MIGETPSEPVVMAPTSVKCGEKLYLVVAAINAKKRSSKTAFLDAKSGQEVIISSTHGYVHSFIQQLLIIFHLLQMATIAGSRAKGKPGSSTMGLSNNCVHVCTSLCGYV